jgi:hypothetical protein
VNNVFKEILGKWFTDDEIANEAILLLGPYATGDILLALAIKKAMERLDALQARIEIIEKLTQK